jgi:hypothetical protein
VWIGATECIFRWRAGRLERIGRAPASVAAIVRGRASVHYRVMFGRFIESAAKDYHFIAEALAAFQVLVDALVDQQNAGDIRRDDLVLMGTLCGRPSTAPPCCSLTDNYRRRLKENH